MTPIKTNRLSDANFLRCLKRVYDVNKEQSAFNERLEEIAQRLEKEKRG